MPIRLHLSKIKQSKIQAYKDTIYSGGVIARKIGRSKVVVNCFLINSGSYRAKLWLGRRQNKIFTR